VSLQPRPSLPGLSGDAGSIASRWPTGKVQEEALRVTPRVDRANSSAASRSLRPRAGPVGSLLFAHHNSSWQLGFEHERELQAVAAERFVEPLELGRRIDYIMARCSEHGPTFDVSSCKRIFAEPIEGTGRAIPSAASRTLQSGRQVPWFPPDRILQQDADWQEGSQSRYCCGRSRLRQGWSARASRTS
jgi:hypothetical protein